MKVFAVKKEKEDEFINIPKDKVSCIKINMEEKFNYIIIKNPSDSNRICTINNIKIVNEDKTNKVCLMQGEEDIFRGKEQLNFIDQIGILNIESSIEKCEDCKRLELTREELLENEECNILKDSVLIILPKGCLFLKLDKEVSNLRVNIDWTSEEIC